MACRRPIVATDVGGIREALEGCGLLVRSRHPFELGNAIITLLKNRDLREQVASAAFKRVHERFTVDQCISTYRNEYNYWINAYKKSEEGVSIVHCVKAYDIIMKKYFSAHSILIKEGGLE